MAMNKTILGPSIKAKVDAAIVGVEPTDPTYASKVYEAMADAIIEHLTTYMEVEIPVTNNVGIAVSGTATVTSQGTNEGQTIGPGSGIS